MPKLKRRSTVNAYVKGAAKRAKERKPESSEDEGGEHPERDADMEDTESQGASMGGAQSSEPSKGGAESSEPSKPKRKRRKRTTVVRSFPPPAPYNDHLAFSDNVPPYDPTQPQFTALDDILGGPLDPELAARNRQIMEDLGLRLNTGPYIEDLRVPMPVAPYNGPGTESV